MKLIVLFMIFIAISKTRTVSLLTGSYDQNSTDLINERRELKEIDVLRQIINQETIIRLAMVKDVKAAVDNVDSVKRSMVSMETTVSNLQQTVDALIRRVDAQIYDNTLQQMVEALKSQVDALRRDNTLQQMVEALKRQVDTLSQNNTLQQMMEILKTQVDTINQENKRTAMICQNRIQDFDQRFEILGENITNIFEHLTDGKGLKLYSDCMDLYINGHTQSGVYKIIPFENTIHDNQINVYCDMVTEGGGWTAIQKRRSGSVSFNKKWAEYKKGFGTLEDSYWIGNGVIHRLSRGRNSSLYVSITLQNGTKLHELYDQFSVSNEADNYKLFLGGPATGTLGDRMLNTASYGADLSGMSFSTPDRDNDRSGRHCADSYKGGWWFNRCHHAFLNGPWSSYSWTYPWYPTVTYGSKIKETLMMIKRH